jgi:CheY-like chemotaxis protein
MIETPASVLVVDDDFDICDCYGEALADCGYQVAIAHNGLEALQHLESCDVIPAVILVDLMMPIMDGRELVAELRQRLRFDRTPIVMMTANRVLGLVDGTIHLYKPFSLEMLCDVIHELVFQDLRPARAITVTS